MRYLQKLCLGVLLAIAPVAAPAVGSEVALEFHSDNWRGTAHVSSETGAFTHCTLAALPQSGAVLLFSMAADRELYISVYRPGWGLKAGRHVYDISFDGADAGRFVFEARGDNTISRVVGFYAETVAYLARASILRLDGDLTMSFRLDGLGPALHKLARCTDLAELFPDPADPPDPAFSGTAFRDRISSAWFQGLLKEAGFVGFEMLKRQEDDLYAWEGDRLTGVATVLDEETVDADGLIADRTERYRQHCNDTFSARDEEPVQIGAWLLSENRASCANSDSANVKQLLTARHRRAGYLIVVVNYIARRTQEDLKLLDAYANRFGLALANGAVDLRHQQ